ncbi:hypothetical protein BELL_0348g00080 [Botrytis elliptica]|uniref:Uncharacterized protein n=1 Tax=Botrytis elliptica TaxID=278938 RepID=A0A4Z1JWR3_9HELO|nr:hypothetical protein BELL_0348g00080 [Botrytis elliptica]
MIVRRMRLRPPRAPPIIAPTGKLLDGYAVLTGAIPVLEVAAGSSVMVDDMIAGVEVDTLGLVANDEEDTVTVLSRVDMLTAARDEEDIVAGMGEVMVGTASQTAEPGAFAHLVLEQYIPSGGNQPGNPATSRTCSFIKAVPVESTISNSNSV